MQREIVHSELKKGTVVPPANIKLVDPAGTFMLGKQRKRQPMEPKQDKAEKKHKQDKDEKVPKSGKVSRTGKRSTSAERGSEKAPQSDVASSPKKSFAGRKRSGSVDRVTLGKAPIRKPKEGKMASEEDDQVLPNKPRKRALSDVATALRKEVIPRKTTKSSDSEFKVPDQPPKPRKRALSDVGVELSKGAVPRKAKKPDFW